MRLNESIVISAPPKLVWDYIAEPDELPALHVGRHALGGRGRAADRARRPLPDADPGRLGRGRRPDRDRRVERAERDMAWSSVTGVDQRGRWRLRELDDGRTRVELRYAYGVAGAGIPGWIAELVAAPSWAATCAARCTSSSARSSTRAARRGRPAPVASRRPRPASFLACGRPRPGAGACSLRAAPMPSFFASL